MSDDIIFTDYDKFCEKIGILSEKELEELGWPVDNGNRICCSKHTELCALIEILNAEPNGTKYHIATDLDPCDTEWNAVEKYCKGLRIEPEDYEEEVRAYGSCIVNSIAYVNRMDYFLCNGDDNENIYLEDECEIQDDREDPNSVKFITEE